MDQQQTLSKVVEIIRPFAKNAEALASAGPHTRLLEDLGVNSARLVDIILDMEEGFGIAVDDESADRVRTLGDAIALVEQKTRGKPN